MGDVEKLIAGAAALAPEGGSENEAFTLLLEGLGHHQLELGDLAGLAADLKDGQAPGFGELMFEPRGDDRLMVSFLSYRVECLASPLIRAIDRLRAAMADPGARLGPTTEPGNG